MTIGNKAIFFLLLTAVIWSTGGVMIKWVDWNPLAVAGIRSVIAAAIIKAAFKGEPLSLKPVAWGGAIAYCGAVTLFVIATKLTTAANAILLQYTAPVYVALFGGWLLGEKPARRDWIAIVCVIGGMIFFFLDKVNFSGMVGNLCAVASGVAFAFLFIFMRLQKGASPYSSVLLGNGLTFLISLPFWGEIHFSLENAAAIAYLGIVQLGIAYVFYARAICHVRALDAILITTLEPILNPIWVFLVLGEAPGLYSLIGGAIVISAIVIRGWLTQRETLK